jgi:M6 family metalloprotease-like protein
VTVEIKRDTSLLLSVWLLAAATLMSLLSTLIAPPATANYLHIPAPKVVRWANILCEFSDKDEHLHPKSYYQDLVGNEYGGMEHYWEDVSYGRMDLKIDEIYGWYRLPKPQRYYNNNEPWEVAERFYRHCLNAADKHLRLRDYYGFTFWANGKLQNRGWGFPATVDREGKQRNYGFTIMSEPETWDFDSWAPGGVLAHEMGHGFGLQHSGGCRSCEYNMWDLMGSIGQQCTKQERYRGPPGDVESSEYFCIPQHPLSFQKWRLGWINRDETYVARPASDRIVTLFPVSRGPGNGFLWLKVPLPGDRPGFFFVEAREFEGYDVETVAEAITIYRWDTRPASTGDDPYVIDTDGDARPNDEEAMWRPGETFMHEQSRIRITVMSQNADGSWEVRVRVPSA